MGYQYSPPASANVRQWGSIFNPGETFGLYCSHLSKACQISDISTEWYGESAHAVARGLINIQDRSAIFDNFIFKEFPIYILKREPLPTEFDRLCLIAFVFLLRVQSEGLPVVRAINIDKLLDRSVTPHKSTICIRSVGGRSPCSQIAHAGKPTKCFRSYEAPFLPRRYHWGVRALPNS